MMDVVGKRVKRLDMGQKVTGQAAFADDLKFDGMLYAKVLRSPLPHAKIKRINTRKAENLAGVRVILTAKDVPGENKIGVLGDPFRDQPILADDKVRFIGDSVALVAADTEEIAEKAIKLIKVSYKELPTVFDVEESRKPNSPKLHGESNQFYHRKIYKGDVNEGFAKSDFILEGIYKTPMHEHAYIEPESGIAKIDGDEMTVITCTQSPSRAREEIARILGFPFSKVRVIRATVGGGFGGKIYNLLGCQAALLAFKTRKPVKLTYSRAESMLITTKRQPATCKCKWGFSNEGKILAVEVEVVLNAGAYADHSPAVATRAATQGTGPYEVPNVKIDSYAFYTNQPLGGAMRGFGVPTVCLAHESIMDRAAEKLGVDPLELRLKNAYNVGSKMATGQVLTHDVALKKTLEKARGIVGEWRKNKREFGPIKVGVGVSTVHYGIGSTAPVPNPSSAIVEVLYDGSVIVRSNCADIGQGSDTLIAQIVAEELGIGLDKVKVHTEDSAAGTWTRNTCASGQTYVSGEAARRAAASAKSILLAQAAKSLGVDEGDLVCEKGTIYSKKDQQKKISFQNAVIDCKKAETIILGCGQFKAPTKGLDQNGQGSPYGAYSYVTQIAEVEVNTETGEVKVTKFTSIPEVGTAINPTQVEGQLEGGVSMGLGQALMEEIVLKNGVMQTPTLAQYLIPTILDMPDDLKTDILAGYEPTGPFGAKGVGEVANTPVPSAILSAIHDAVGVRIDEIPVTSEKIYALLQKRDSPVKNF